MPHPNARIAAEQAARKAAKGSQPVAKLSKPVKRAVNRLINAKKETNYRSQVMTPADAPLEIWGDIYPQGSGGGPAGPAQVYAVLPDLQQNDTTQPTQSTDYNRIGEKVMPTKFYTDLELMFNNTRPVIGGGGQLDQASWDITVHVWYGFVRKYKNNADIIANSVSIAQNLLDNGAGTKLRWLGGPTDHQLKINTEYFSGLKHKKVRMYRPLGTQNDATLTGGVTTYFPQKLNKTMRLSYKTPKSLVYNENNTVPENYAPILIIGYQHNDNTQAANTWIPAGAPALATEAPAIIAMIRSHLFFKDG